MASGGCSNKKKAVKIVIITTEYVETDAMSFKSVVQKLTGKCSSDDEATEAQNVNNQSGFDVAASENGDVGRSSFYMNDLLLKEYYMLHRELLPNEHFLFQSQI
ncbi:VQ motif-containing protein 10-like [Vicia villosa]|uniref:VQ motif-containing protein 10-like n=1 Tax=Vicia villosa TaxID=3911 RepID=UPI00273B861B|nr:VQ motif-containing protein 10-like [Vicia villosa]